MGYTKLEGTFEQTDAKIGIVVSRWNDFITSKLLEGALDALKRHGVAEEQVTVVYCPGSYEIPLTCQRLLDTNKVEGVIALGAVIRGSTPHFDYVCSSANKGIADLNLKYNKPVMFGILTTDTIEQAVERAGTKMGNKGAEAAMSLLEMLSLFKQLDT